MSVPRSLAIAAVASGAAIGGAVVLACSAVDDVRYVGSSPTPADAAPDDGGGRIVRDSSLELPDVMAPTFSTTPLGACVDLDGGACDDTAGDGCCFGPSGSGEGACWAQAAFFTVGSACRASGDVFLACAHDDPDSPCCWMNDVGAGAHTRHRAACPAAHACVVGEACSGGDPCTPLPAGCGAAAEVGNVGFCGGPAPCGP